jgi:hypothetical protein
MRASNSSLVFTFSLYTSLFIHLHKPKSKGVRSGDLGGQWTAVFSHPLTNGHMFIWTFLLRIIDNTTSQNIYYSSWNTLYFLSYNKCVHLHDSFHNSFLRQFYVLDIIFWTVYMWELYSLPWLVVLVLNLYTVRYVYNVDGVRLCLWTAPTNVPIVHSPTDIWTWIATVEWSRQRKPPDSSTRALWQS